MIQPPQRPAPFEPTRSEPTRSEPARPEPAWDVATLFPPQGHWTAGDYLSLDTNRLVELSEGRLEVLPMPSERHQLIVAFLFQQLHAFVSQRDLGLCLFAPLRVRTAEDQFREPDLVFMSKEHAERRFNQFWDGADLVMEVVSEDNPERDLVHKRREYEAAGIPEYWIVDPRDKTIEVLSLDPTTHRYRDVTVKSQQGTATSVVLPGFAISIADVFTRRP